MFHWTKKKETANKLAERLGISKNRLHYYIYSLDLKTDEEILEAKKHYKREEGNSLKERAERLGISKNRLFYYLYRLHLKTDKEMLAYVPSKRPGRPPKKKEEEKIIIPGLKVSFDLKDIFAELETHYPSTHDTKTLVEKINQVDITKRGRVLSVA